MPLSKEARKHKVEYNYKRNKELNRKFQTFLSKEYYNELCDYLDSIGMNKAEFIRWAYEELKKRK